MTDLSQCQARIWTCVGARRGRTTPGPRPGGCYEIYRHIFFLGFFWRLYAWPSSRVRVLNQQLERTAIITGMAVSVVVSDAEAVTDAALVAAQRPDKRSASRFHDTDISSGASRTSTRRHQLVQCVRQRGRWPTRCSGDARTPFPAPASRAVYGRRVFLSDSRPNLLRRSGPMRGTMGCRSST